MEGTKNTYRLYSNINENKTLKSIHTAIAIRWLLNHCHACILEEMRKRQTAIAKGIQMDEHAPNGQESYKIL
jgi:hypothetical protein